ncbi:hypothetical protein TWF694_010790 [Orbilia ellipsospora]|uniref:DUF2207 domain-containing protein n=1 Tax=Orbilia ellipsospora TaxID=2528407 RepID=A0AAV9XA14_9PEZI
MYLSHRVSWEDIHRMEAMYRRQVELIRMKNEIAGYLGLLDDTSTMGATVYNNANIGREIQRRRLRWLLADIDKLLSLYGHSVRIYEWYTNEFRAGVTAELTGEQLKEAKESTSTAVSLGKLSFVAFLYLPLNFVCAMLGMNMSIFGQGTVPLWVFFILAIIFGLLTWLAAVLFQMDKQWLRIWKTAYHLGRRSVLAGLWFLAFAFTHNEKQNFEILDSGLSQTLIGYEGSKTKGWIYGKNDQMFDSATWGGQEFWEARVKRIFLAVKELQPSDLKTDAEVV